MAIPRIRCRCARERPITTQEHRMKTSILSLASAALIALAGTTAAQFELGGGVVDLRIDGQLPDDADPAGHQVSGGTSFTLSITDGGTLRPFILLGAASLQAGAVPLAGVGTIDLPNPGVFILMNGIFPSGGFDFFAVTDFSVTVAYAPPCTLVTSLALQAIALDPTSSPLPYTLTQAGQPVSNGVTIEYDNDASDLDDDDFKVFTPVCLPGVTFGGTTYTQMFVGANGYVTFGSGSTLYSPTQAEFFAGFQTPPSGANVNPGAAVMADDYGDISTVGDTVAVIENLANGSVTVEWRNQEHWNSLAAAGTFSVTFAASDTVSMDFSSYVLGDSAFDPNPLVGVTDGDSAVGINTTVDYSAVVPFSSTGTNDSIVEEVDLSLVLPGAAFDVATLQFAHAGSFSWVVL
jgi:hypothetical protein